VEPGLPVEALEALPDTLALAVGLVTWPEKAPLALALVLPLALREAAGLALALALGVVEREPPPPRPALPLAVLVRESVRVESALALPCAVCEGVEATVALAVWLRDPARRSEKVGEKLRL
jgi:hypothetical protein